MGADGIPPWPVREEAVMALTLTVPLGPVRVRPPEELSLQAAYTVRLSFTTVVSVNRAPPPLGAVYQPRKL